jgi:hypothetical protein
LDVEAPDADVVPEEALFCWLVEPCAVFEPVWDWVAAVDPDEVPDCAEPVVERC